MSEYMPVATIEEFRTLDEAEILLGYLAGVEGQPIASSSVSRSFHHGWRNGLVDAGLSDALPAQIALADEFRALAP